MRYALCPVVPHLSEIRLYLNHLPLSLAGLIPDVDATSPF